MILLGVLKAPCRITRYVIMPLVSNLLGSWRTWERSRLMFCPALPITAPAICNKRFIDELLPVSSQTVSYFAGNEQADRLFIVPIPLPRTIQVRGLGIGAFHVKHDFLNLDLQQRGRNRNHWEISRSTCRCRNVNCLASPLWTSFLIVTLSSNHACNGQSCGQIWFGLKAPRWMKRGRDLLFHQGIRSTAK